MKVMLTIFIFFMQISFSIECYGAEYRTIEDFTYGRFEVRMMSGSGDGTLASFFTYNTNLNGDVYGNWNEIDIEILGAYDNYMQCTTHTPGNSSPVSITHYEEVEYNIHEEFHVYAFEWVPGEVKWFIDGQEVYSQTGSHIDNLVHAQKIMMNTWSSIYENWVGTFNVEDLPVYAFYDYVSYYNYTPGYGDYGSGNNFTFSWTDNFDDWDQSKWTKESHTFWGNRCQFNPSNVVFEDGYLILCLTNLNNLGFNGQVPDDHIYGCTDVNAINYNIDATHDNNTCEYLAYFSVDISNLDLSGLDNNGNNFYGVYLQGNFNNWCGWCNAMSDSNNDNIYETAVILSPGQYEYQYSINGWDWYIGSPPIESECDYIPNDEWINYGFELENEDIYLSTFYFGTCTESQESSCSFIGDVNSDNLLNVLDIVILVESIINSTENDFILNCIDINQDSNFNVLDIIQLIAIIVD